MSKAAPGRRRKRRKHDGRPAGAITTPSNRDLCVSAAYLRIIGRSQAEAAAGVGVSERAVRAWEASDFWPQVEEEAHSRWLKHVTIGARQAILTAYRDKREYAPMAKWAAERLIRELAPPTQKHDMKVRMTWDEMVAELDADSDQRRTSK